MLFILIKLILIRFVMFTLNNYFKIIQKWKVAVFSKMLVTLSFFIAAIMLAFNSFYLIGFIVNEELIPFRYYASNLFVILLFWVNCLLFSLDSKWTLSLRLISYAAGLLSLLLLKVAFFSIFDWLFGGADVYFFIIILFFLGVSVF